MNGGAVVTFLSKDALSKPPLHPSRAHLADQPVAATAQRLQHAHLLHRQGREGRQKRGITLGILENVKCLRLLEEGGDFTSGTRERMLLLLALATHKHDDNEQDDTQQRAYGPSHGRVKRSARGRRC